MISTSKDTATGDRSVSSRAGVAPITPSTRVSALVVGEIHCPTRPPQRHGGALPLLPRLDRGGQLANARQRPRERRRAERVPLECQVTFRFRCDDPLSLGKTRDASRGGLFVETGRALSTKVCIAGTLRAVIDGRPHELRFVAEVVWSARWTRVQLKGGGFAVRFLHLNREDQRLLHLLLAS